MPTGKLQRVEEGSCKDWCLRHLSAYIFLFCRVHLPKPIENKNKCQFLACLASLAARALMCSNTDQWTWDQKWSGHLSETSHPEERGRETRSISFSIFLILHIICVGLWCLVLWQPLLDHEERAKGITEKLTQSPNIAEPPNESFWCEAHKPLFQSLLVSVFSFLKPKVSYLTYLYNSYTFLLECKFHEDRDRF